MTTSSNSLTSRLFAFTTVAAALGLGLVSMGSQGCTVTTGDSDAGGFSFDSGPKPDSGVTPPTGNAACNSCLFQQCSGQWAVCQSSTECTAIYQCATKTGCDQNCVTACFNAHPTGQNAYTALYTCDQVGACAPGCQSPCGTPASSCPQVDPVDSGTTTDSGTVTPGPVDCTGCAQTKCKTENDKCGVGSDCDQYSQCTTVCNDTPCIDACGEAHATGKTDSNALATCTTTSCKVECGL
ncbi:MAG: hypothetical protein JWM74_6324 [Myxococcaceae bacterium]|jgi:hypothetical protein|nr:hypothetical protein [Myxococcaceae bacterium]